MGNTASETPMYRGGNSTNLSQADVNSSLNKTTNLIEPGKGGLSINTNKMDANIQKYGGAFELNSKTLPKGLQIINKPVGGSHYIITPTYPMPQNVFQSLLNDVELLKFNQINR